MSFSMIEIEEKYIVLALLMQVVGVSIALIWQHDIKMISHKSSACFTIQDKCNATSA